VERGSLLPGFKRLISVEDCSLLDRGNLLKPLVVPLGSFEACVEVPSNKIGFVRMRWGCQVDAEACKPAGISIDSFPFSNFGVLRGAKQPASVSMNWSLAPISSVGNSVFQFRLVG
jgi:hypothetical protein